MPGYLRQSTASQSRALGPFVDDTDFKTAKTGLTIANTDIKLVVNGAASANKNSGGGTHRVNGVYGVTFDATDTATVGEMEVSVSVAGALLVFDKFYVVEEAVFDALFVAAAPGYVVDQPVNTTKFGGTTVTARDIGLSVLLSSGSGTGQLDFTSGVVKANAVQWLGGTIPAVNVTGVPLVDLKYTLGTISPATAGSVRADAVTGAVGSVTAAVTVGTINASVITATSIAADAITAAKVADGTIDAATFAAGAINAAAIATDAITAAKIAADAITAAKIADGAIDAATFAAGAINAAAIAADAITDAKVAADVTIASVTGAVGSVTGAVGSVTGNVGGNVVGTVASVVGAVGSVTGNVGGNVVGSVASVTARVTANTDQFAGQTITAAAGVTVPASIASPTNITAGVITTVTNLTNAPTAGDFTATMKTSIGTAVAASAVASVTGNVGGNVTGSVGSVASGGIAASSFAAGAIDAAAIAADAIGSSELAASAVTEIQAGLATSSAQSAIQAVTDLLNSMIEAGVGSPTYSRFKQGAVEAVWDAILSAHLTSGTAGAALNAIGDPWSTSLPGAYGAGTAGKIVGDNVNATISSRATQTSVDTIDDFVDTEVSAIKAKTDNLPASPAATGDAMTLSAAYDFAKGTVAMTESYAADGAAMTPAQAFFMIWATFAERALAGTTMTVKKLDGSTDAMTFTLDDASNPTSQTRAT